VSAQNFGEVGRVSKSRAAPHLGRGYASVERRLKHARGDINARFDQLCAEGFPAGCERPVQGSR